MDTQPEETLPANEILARQLEALDEEFDNLDQQPDLFDFKDWEQRLLSLFEKELPALVSIYRNSIHRAVSYYFGNPVLHDRRAVHEFLWNVIDEVREGRLAQIESDPISASKESAINTKRIFIGHGRSSLWRDLKDFLQDRLKLEWDEFNRESAAGISTVERLEAMLNGASFAFLILTAEDEHSDGTVHARENVVHESGLFQGKLGFRRAILLVEEGCKEFSNISGLTQIRFPRGDISARFEEVRRVLEREHII